MSRPITVEGWPRPRGYANGMAARGELVAIAGQIGWDEHEVFHSDDLGAQFHQALSNVVAVVNAAGGAPEHIISMTIFVTDKREYIAARSALAGAWRELLGRHYPAMALVEVSALLEDRAKVEIQALAVVPSPEG